MGQIPSWEAKWFLASQEITHILWNLNVHFHTRKCPSILSQLNPVHAPTSRRSILILSSHLHLGLPGGLFSSGFSMKTLSLPFLSPIWDTCPAYLILLYLITRTILVEEYKSLSSLLCSFLHSPVTSSHLGPNILLNIEFSNTLNVRKRPSFIFIQNNWHNYSSVQLNLWWGTRLRSWLRHCPTSRKVAGSIPDGGIEIFHWHNPSVRTMALGLTQPLTEMSTRNISWGVKMAGS